ncbi:MAG: co-chaperone DjlA [Planctomycetota bacterium]
MNCTGKFFGALIGLILFNIPGAIIGFVLGHVLIDSHTSKNSKGYAPGYSYDQTYSDANPTYATETYSTEFLQSLCGMMAKLTKSDGIVTSEEIQMIERFFNEVLQLDSGARRLAIDNFRAAKNSPQPFRAYARKFARLTSGNPEIREQVLQLLMTLAAADGTITTQEEALLKEAADIFAVGGNKYSDLRRNYGSEMSHYYAVLGLTPDSTNDEIKARYRELAREYHPDVIAGKGMPKDFIDYATKKFQDIQEAYAKIREERGFR